MMKRRDLITLLGGAAAAWPLASRAQQPGQRRIGVLLGRPDNPEGQASLAAFLHALGTAGWSDGRNLQIDSYWDAANPGRTQALAKEIVERQPDVILAETTPVVATLRRENSQIPIVFVNVSDPVGSGFIASLAHPSGTITGFISNEPSLAGKWPELLKEISPSIRRVGFLFNPDTAPYAEGFLRQAEASTHSLGLELIVARVHDDAEIERAMSALASEAGGALMVLPEATTNSRSELIIKLAARNHLPAIYAFRFEAVAGGLISYGVDLIDSFRASASYVDRILRGEKASDLPVQAPTKFELVINLITAKGLGLEVPLFLQQRADEVIE